MPCPFNPSKISADASTATTASRAARDPDRNTLSTLQNASNKSTDRPGNHSLYPWLAAGKITNPSAKAKMKALNPGVLKVAPDSRLMIKSQKRVDMGPFMRYSCWHCTNPPCVKRCPFTAMAKMPTDATNPVW